MIEHAISPPNEAVEHFSKAASLLSNGRFEGFMDEWIQGRSVLKQNKPPPGASIAAPASWRDLNSTFECLFEWRIGGEVLQQVQGDFPWVQAESPNFLGARSDLAAFNSIARGDADTLVVAGSGAFPQTMFYLARHSGIKQLVGIDLDPERAFFASRLSERCGLSDRLSFKVKNAADFDYSGANITIIASLIEGKAAVVERIGETAPPGSLVCLRIPRGWGAAFYEQPREALTASGQLKELRRWFPAEDSLFETVASEVLPRKIKDGEYHEKQSNPLENAFFGGRFR